MSVKRYLGLILIVVSFLPWAAIPLIVPLLLLSICQEIAVWQQQPNQHKAKIDWRFAAIDARMKFQRSYPPTYLS